MMDWRAKVLTFSLVLTFLCMFDWASPAVAHDSRPISLRITEKSEALFSVTWQVPGSVANENQPSPRLPTMCNPLSPPKLSTQSGARIGEQIYHCHNKLSGEIVEIDFPLFNPSLTAVVQIDWMSGETVNVVLAPNELTWKVPEKSTPANVSKRYFTLGMIHIFGGYDHLLFLLCLLLIARTPKRTIVTVTGFTLAHSFTLALAVFQVIRLPIAAVETVIALSIVFLAVEIARGRSNTLSFRYPVIVASAFGLLHGLGFASVLSEIGLPSGQVPLALLLFNLGIEAGQLLILAPTFIGIVWFARHEMTRTPRMLRSIAVQRTAIYVVGGLASFWFLERFSQAFSL